MLLKRNQSIDKTKRHTVAFLFNGNQATPPTVLQWSPDEHAVHLSSDKQNRIERLQSRTVHNMRSQDEPARIRIVWNRDSGRLIGRTKLSWLVLRAPLEIIRDFSAGFRASLCNLPRTSPCTVPSKWVGEKRWCSNLFRWCSVLQPHVWLLCETPRMFFRPHREELRITSGGRKCSRRNTAYATSLSSLSPFFGLFSHVRLPFSSVPQRGFL